MDHVKFIKCFILLFKLKIYKRLKIKVTAMST